jgi:hypothetical protein
VRLLELLMPTTIPAACCCCCCCPLRMVMALATMLLLKTADGAVGLLPV